MAVFYFAQQRAVNFARTHKRQAFWIQAIDTPPNWFCNGYSTTELEEMKKRWLAYHARKTEGILSLLLCCYDMPLIVKHSGGPDYKKYGVHNGSRCRLKAWELDDKDAECMQAESDEGMLVLKAMPKILYIELENPLKEPYPDLPDRWFKMKPVETYWTLDADEHIEIARRGFPLVPNFSTTIDGATGQTLKSSIADLGDFGSMPSFHAAMRGYIALSRVTAADNMLIARTFNPLLFRLGPQPFPSLLFRALQGEMDNMPEEAFIQLCAETEKKYKKKNLLKDALWKCSSCQLQLPWTAYCVQGSDKEWHQQYEDQICRPGALRECHKCNPNEDARKKSQVQTHLCGLCKRDLPKEDFPVEMWHHRLEQGARCQDCCRPRCTNKQCETCKFCRDETCNKQHCSKVIKSLNPKQFPRTVEERDQWLCLACRLFKCSLCKVAKSEKAYPASMWYNRNNKNQNILCFDCCRPACVWQSCKTCKICRKETCKRRNKCSETMESLNPRQHPPSIEERNQWLCYTCRYIVCQACRKKEMPRKQQRQVKNSTCKKLWTCGDCLTLAESKQTMLKYR